VRFLSWPSVNARAGQHNDAMWQPRWLSRKVALASAIAAALLCGAAGWVFLGPAWAAAGVALGLLAVFAAILVIIVFFASDPGQMLEAGRTGEAVRLLRGELAAYRPIAAKLPGFVSSLPWT
jgi:hypothetical protein